MLPVCLQNVVSIKDLCNPLLYVESTSGYDIFDAPEINMGIVADLAIPEKSSGIEVLKDLRNKAIKDFSIDFINHLNSAQLTPNLIESKIITSGGFDTSQTNGVYAGKRGLTVWPVSGINGIKKATIKKLKILPKQSGNFSLEIHDEYNNLITALTLALTANVVNEFYLNYPISGSYARVLLDNTALETSSTNITCLRGCGGKAPNTCGYVTGWDGSKDVKTEGFGMVVEFACVCDYASLICRLSKSYVGKLLFTKFRMGVIEHTLYSNRLTNWIIYGREERVALLKDLTTEYNDLFHTLSTSLPSQIKSYEREGCISCRGISIRANI